MLITFEGGEGAGKTTLIERMEKALIERGFSVVKTRAPGATSSGVCIRELLLHHEEPLVSKAELFLYLADRAEHVAKVIQPALDAQKIVLCDRFNDSTVAYQAAGRGFDPKFVRQLCSFATNGLEPNLTLYLDVDPEIGLERVKKMNGAHDKIESEKITFHQKIRSAYQRMAKEEKERFYILNASLEPEDVFSAALILLNNKLCTAT